MRMQLPPELLLPAGGLQEGPMTFGIVSHRLGR